MNVLKVGDIAPDFSCKNQYGELINLSDMKGKKIVVFFFPRADTSGCTAESIAFTNLQKEFDKLNCIVIGISKDNQKKQGKFRLLEDINGGSEIKNLLLSC